MEIEAAFYSFITSQAVTSSLVSTRVYPLNIPQEATLPAVAYQRISGGRELTHGGPQQGLLRARLQVTITAVNYDEVKAAAAAIRLLFNGFRGWWGPAQGTGVYVQFCSVEELGDGYGATMERVTTRLDLVVNYR